MIERPIRCILVPIEFTELSEPEVGFAIAFAKQLGAELLLFGVIDRPAMISLIGKHRTPTTSTATLNELLVEDAKGILQRIVDHAAELGVEARGHATISEEVPEQILKEAMVQKVDLILIRPHARSLILKALFGSTVAEVLKAAPCPVLVMHG